MAYGILLENGDNILLEDGGLLLLELLDVSGETQAVQGAVLDRILSDLKTRITWEQFGECRNMAAERIVMRYVPYQEYPDEQQFDEDMPAIVVSPGPRVLIKGDLNCSDDVVYTVLIQIVDTDYHDFNMDRAQTWMRWQEQIRAYFSEGSLRALDRVNRVTCRYQEWLDRGRFGTYKNAVFALVLGVVAREGRDSAGH